MIHGFYTLLHTALTEAGYYNDTKPHKFLIAGDLFDRSKEAVELQSFILDLLDRGEVILICGNYEDLFEELVTVDKGLRYDHLWTSWREALEQS